MNDFDDIRPFYDSEIPAAMRRIADNETLPKVVNYLYPDANIDEFKHKLLGIQNTKDFQEIIMKTLLDVVFDNTTAGISYTGFENIDKQNPYLFVSNHRDITLDAVILQFMLYYHGCNLCQITFGSNLMCHPLIIDIGKSNRMFRTERGGTKSELLRNLSHLSDYIRFVVTQNKQSVWIAQRNGRTKDGNDVTNPAIIKMFAMSGNGDAASSLAELNLAPVAVSYEWEPCDVLKALEIYMSQDGKYEKKQGEDVNSIITGLTSQKGKVHLHICEPLSDDELYGFRNCTANDYFKNVAALIDERIYAHYELMPNNYIAYDIMDGHHRFADKYTEQQKQDFLSHAEWVKQYPDFDESELRTIFLAIYANPVKNAILHGVVNPPDGIHLA